MIGGLYFGPPAWLPAAIVDHTTPPAQGVPPTAPQTREALHGAVSTANIGRTTMHGPSLGEQLETLSGRSIRALVVNLLPLQPEFVLGRAMIQLFADDLLPGLQALIDVIKPRQTLIVFDRYDWALKRLLRRARKGRPIKLRGLLNRYPQGDATVLLRTLAGKRLPVGAPPTETNHIVIDPVALWALGRYLRTGLTFDRRPVQLFLPDEAPRLIMGTIGETLRTCCNRHAIGVDRRQVIINGMLAGTRAERDDVIQGHTESISLRDVPIAEVPAPCISCGWCIDHCPTGLNPVELLQLAQTGKTTSSAAGEAKHCIGCGLCSYVCPTRLPMTPNIVALRNTLEAGGRT